MIPAAYPDKAEIARLTARMLLEIGAVNFRPDEPFILASGLPAPDLYRLPQADLLPAHPLDADGLPRRHGDARGRASRPSTTSPAARPPAFPSPPSSPNGSPCR